ALPVPTSPEPCPVGPRVLLLGAGPRRASSGGGRVCDPESEGIGDDLADDLGLLVRSGAGLRGDRAAGCRFGAARPRAPSRQRLVPADCRRVPGVDAAVWPV